MDGSGVEATESRRSLSRPSALLLLTLLLLGLALGLLLFAAFVAVLESRKPNGSAQLSAGLTPGTPAPAFEVTTLDGSKLSLRALEGQPVWLNFWAVWCGPCRAEMPDILKANEEAKRQGVKLVAIDVGEPEQTVRAYLQRGGFEALPAALDPAGVTTASYRVDRFPTHVFIDARGIVQKVNYGAMNPSEYRDVFGQLKPK
ncbi:MAG: redoxin domain-containing protein [Chloroflexota bacterium]|nr:redoxin domain-containing protein [Chloroflexota bacterium]